jgi:septum formation protein
MILASSSPRRHQLFGLTGLPFVVARPDIDETPHPGEAGGDYVLRLSREKAHAVAQSAPPNSLILSADTSVIDGDHILGKPESDADATDMLRQLRGRVHLVHTGVTLLDTDSGQTVTRLTTTRVIMRSYTDQEIAAYVESGDPMGKAGSYAVQNETFHPAAQLDRCYTNVMGLPMCTVYVMLAELGVHPHITRRCFQGSAHCEFDTTRASCQ